METEVQRIRTEGRAIDPVRNVERLWLELDVVPVNGIVIEGHMVQRNGRIEVYADRLRNVLARTRTPDHDAAHEQAVKMAAMAIAEWKSDSTHRRALARMHSDAEREAYVNINCNVRPEHQLPLLGYREGLPPIRSCKVVRPQTGETMDARKWQALDDSKRAEWLVDAPVTPMNAAQRANEHLAATIARVLERAATKK